MAASVKIEFDDGSRVISQTLEDAAGVAGAGGNGVVLGEERPASCSMDDYYEARRIRKRSLLPRTYLHEYAAVVPFHQH